MLLISDLIPEILELIFSHLCDDGFLRSSLLAASLANQRFREIAKRFIFRSVTIPLTRGNSVWCPGATQYCAELIKFLRDDTSARLAIRHVTVPPQFVEQPVCHPHLERLLMDLLSNAPHLRSIRLGSCRNISVPMLHAITQLGAKLALFVDIYDPTADDQASLRGSTSLQNLIVRVPWAGKFGSSVPKAMELAHEVIINSPNLRVLHLKFMTGATFGAFRTTPMQLDRCLNVPFKRHEFLPSLEELGLEGEIQLPDADWEIMEQNIDWSRIRRLDLQNDELAETLLSRYGDRLSNLRSLKLSANRSIKDHSLRSVALGAGKRKNIMAFIEARRFEELEIMGFTRDVPVQEITNSGTSLEVLRLSIQMGPAILTKDLVFDLEVLRTLNDCCPCIDRLGINGSVEYGGITQPLLDTLASFEKLRHLELFVRTPEDFTSALTNRDAVSIFSRLRLHKRGYPLHSLSFFHFADGASRRWTLWAIADKTELTIKRYFPGNPETPYYEYQETWLGDKLLEQLEKRVGHQRLEGKIGADARMFDGFHWKEDIGMWIIPFGR